MAIGPALLAREREVVFAPVNCPDAHRRLQDDRSLPLKRRRKREETVMDFHLGIRVSTVAGFKPANSCWSIALPVIFARPGRIRIIRNGKIVDQWPVRQFLQGARLQRENERFYRKHFGRKGIAEWAV